jgi:hypothetical protein
LQTRDDRETVRTRQDLGQKQTAVKTQVQMLLKRNGLEKPDGIGTNWSKRYREWLGMGNADSVSKPASAAAVLTDGGRTAGSSGPAAGSDVALFKKTERYISHSATGEVKHFPRFQERV